MQFCEPGGLTLVELMIVVGVIVVIAAVALPGIMRSQRGANEVAAMVSLKTLSVAETDFRTGDRDGNHVLDFWTGDVSGFFSMTSATVPGNTDPVNRIVDMSLASADAAPLPNGAAGGEMVGITSFTPSAPKSGYWVAVLDGDAGTGDDFQNDTGGKIPMGPVHNLSRFGFITYPDVFRVSGEWVFIINESSAVFKTRPSGPIRPSASIPPGPLSDPEYKDWPTPGDLKAKWVKVD